MNFAELGEEDDHDAKVRMMSVYDRLLRLRSVLEYETFSDTDVTPHEIMAQLNELKKEYLEIVPEVLGGYSSVIKYGDVKILKESEICFSRNGRIDDILN
jgi:hypothetical protein